MHTNLARIATVLVAAIPTVFAQEIAKDVTLDGWVDSSFTATTSNDDATASTTGFATDALLRVGWKPSERIATTFAGRVDENGNLTLSEAYGTVTVTDALTLSSGKSYGPFGYFAAEPTGLPTVTQALSTQLYTLNPVAAWATWTPIETVVVTAIVAEAFTDAGHVNRPASLSPGLDVNYTPISDLVFDWELFVDPSAGGIDEDGHRGDLWYTSANVQYTHDALTTAAEIIYEVVGSGGKTSDDDQKRIAWAAFATYALPVELCPMSVTAQVSQLHLGTTRADLDLPANSAVALSDATKGQIALLTNPLGAKQFSLNGEFFCQRDKVQDQDAVVSYGGAVEGLYVIP